MTPEIEILRANQEQLKPLLHHSAHCQMFPGDLGSLRLLRIAALCHLCAVIAKHLRPATLPVAGPFLSGPVNGLGQVR